MKLKRDTKFVEKSTHHFKIGIRNLRKFDPSTQKSLNENFHFKGLLLSKVYIVWAKKVQKNSLSWNWRRIKNLERNWLVVSKLDKFWPEHSKVSNIFILMGSFWTKYILFELKKYRGIIFHETAEWCKIWRKTN